MKKKLSRDDRVPQADNKKSGFGISGTHAKQVFLLTVSVFLYVFSFPGVGYHALAWFCLVPLLRLLSGTKRTHAFVSGWLFGGITNLAVTHWIVYAMFRHSDSNLLTCLLFPLFLVGILFGLYLAVFAVAASHLLKSGLNKPITMIGVAGLWTVLEFCRAGLFSGLPWQLFGYSQYKATSIIQIAEFTGVYGISFLIVLVNLLIHYLFFQKVTVFSILKYGIPVAVIFFVISGYGQLRINGLAKQAQKVNQPSLLLGVVQSNVAQHRKWNKRYHDAQVNDHLRASIPLMEQGADLIVWPETAVPFYLQRKMPISLIGSLRQFDAFLITGGQRYEKSKEGYRYFNSAFQINGNGIRKSYDKIHLLPFAEYFPFNRVDFLGLHDAGEREYSPGTEHTVFAQKGLRYGILICFETLYPKLARGLVRNQADFLVNIANYAWFGNFGAQEQQFSHNVVRAVEFRRPVIVSSNTGVSGIIDASGTIVSRIPPHESGSVMQPLFPHQERTVYYHYGDLFVMVCLGFLLCLFLYCLFSDW